MEQEGGKEILEPYQLLYSDLICLSSSSPLSSSTEHVEQINESVMEALGPDGPGLLAITDVPNAYNNLRNKFLPRARHLSLLDHDHRNRILKDHGLGSDVPLKNLDRCVSSFAMQLKYGNGLDSSNLGCGNVTPHGNNCSMDNLFKDLSGSFRELGLFMIDLGFRLARICDRAIGGEELERSLLESGTAKGRLIHYHSYLDSSIIKESGKIKGSKKGKTYSEPVSVPCRGKKSPNKNGQVQGDGDDERSCEKLSDLWQQWHYDYGTFTVLTSPMFMRSICCLTDNMEVGCPKFGVSECLSPSGHTYLQIVHPNKNSICFVKAPPESYILQVGESADILSRRKLRSILHSVSRPIELDNLSRETFVVFLHPAWNKPFDISDYPKEHLTSTGELVENGDLPEGDEQELKKLPLAIHKIIPPLSSRLKDRMTFAEFSRETTKQYYSGSGLQSNR